MTHTKDLIQRTADRRAGARGTPCVIPKRSQHSAVKEMLAMAAEGWAGSPRDLQGHGNTSAIEGQADRGHPSAVTISDRTGVSLNTDHRVAGLTEASATVSA